MDKETRACRKLTNSKLNLIQLVSVTTPKFDDLKQQGIHLFFNCIYYYFIVGPCWLSILNIAVCCYRLVAKSCLTLCNHMDCRPPGSSVHGISQARILEWVAISSSRSSSKSRDQTSISCIGRWILSYTLISYVL